MDRRNHQAKVARGLRAHNCHKGKNRLSVGPTIKRKRNIFSIVKKLIRPRRGAMIFYYSIYTHGFKTDMKYCIGLCVQANFTLKTFTSFH